MNQRKIIEAMEAYRSDSDDLQNAEMSELAEALQQDAAIRERCDRIGRWDRVVGDAIRSGPVPEGLCDRLFDTLSIGDSASTAATAERRVELSMEPIGPNDDAVALPTPASDSLRRRSRVRSGWLLATTLVAAALVLIAVQLLPFGSPTPQLTADFADEVIEWTLATPPASWETDFTASGLHDRPFDASVQVIPRRWASIETRYSPHTVVYDLTSQRNTPAYLFCFSSSGSSLPPSPPNEPFSTTGGFSLGAWQRGDLVYVLAVRGEKRRYRGLIQSAVLLGWRQSIPTSRAIVSI